MVTLQKTQKLEPPRVVSWYSRVQLFGHACVDSQLVCLLPVGIFNLLCFILVVIVSDYLSGVPVN